MLMHAHFKNIDEIIATIKVAIIKNNNRIKDFHDAGLPSPPESVITRWATWLRAALYYRVKTFQLFVPLSTIGQVSVGLLVSRAKDTFNMEYLGPNLVVYQPT